MQTKQCELCEKMFIRAGNVSITQWKTRSLCSRKCAVKKMSTTKVVECASCSKLFKPRRPDIKCCSLPCSHVNKTIKTESKVCAECGAVFTREHGLGLSLWNRRKLCSAKCRTSYAGKNKIGFQIGHDCYSKKGRFTKGFNPWNKDKKTGQTPWNKGKIGVLKNPRKGMGVGPIKTRVRNSVNYREWRTSVFVRDNYSCVHCGVHGGTLHVDHIVPFSKILKSNNIQTLEDSEKCLELWDISNGRTLCISCHRKTDTWGARSF